MWLPWLPVRYVYWTDWGDKAFIGRVGMDGTNKAAIITTKIEWPNGITIDYTNDKLYWSDAHLSYIEWVHQAGITLVSPTVNAARHLTVLFILSDTQTWMVNTDTQCTMEICLTRSPWLCSRTLFTGLTGTRAQWRKETNTMALGVSPWSTPLTDHSMSKFVILTDSPLVS